MIKRIVLIIGCSIVLFSCTKVSVELPRDSEWVYYNNEALKNRYPTHKHEYQIQVKDSLIFAKSLYSKKCEIINRNGIVIDIIPYDSIPFNIYIKREDSTKAYVWETWKYKVIYSDKSRVTELNYITRPIESLKLLSRQRPKREHRLEYTLDGKKYSMALPTTRGSSSIYNVCQYDETLFLFSAYLKIEDIEYSGARYYVFMLDLEDFTHKYFLGIKLW
ncbi:hypothetical protein DFO77_119105 [Marinilabilia salmonicolor]|uniref:Lipoprotein n=1 Tax=Marinilabilia salmonicolor TaxID=989 RepID=A0A368UQN5_9BACT|nr:hypothetical protein DFO77_119105 [Marinilabilia salmonicolor]